MSAARIGNLLYVPTDVAFAEMPDSGQLQIDDYGLDGLTRIYGGAPSKLKTFLATQVAGAPDSIYPNMTIVGKPNVSPGRAWTTATVKFTGKVDGQQPLDTVTDGWHEETIQAQGVPVSNPNTIVQIILDYRAPETTYSYYRQIRPDGPQFETSNARQGQLGIQIIAKRGVAKLNGVDIGPLLQAVLPKVRLARFDREQVANWFKMTETWEWRLEQSQGFFADSQTLITL